MKSFKNLIGYSKLKFLSFFHYFNFNFDFILKFVLSFKFFTFYLFIFSLSHEVFGFGEKIAVEGEEEGREIHIISFVLIPTKNKNKTKN